jgi:hypothetical protein
MADNPAALWSTHLSGVKAGEAVGGPVEVDVGEVGAAVGRHAPVPKGAVFALELRSA